MSSKFSDRKHVSYSQITTYLMCPMKYAHHYIWGTPPESKPIALILGKSIHRVAESYYSSLKKTGLTLPIEVLVQIFEEAFDDGVAKSEVPLSLKKGDTLQEVRDQGVEMVRVFHAEIKPQQIVAVELPFSVSIPDIKNGGKLPYVLVGVFDLVESDQDGTYLICELKTSAQKYSSIKLEYDLQPTVYSYALSQMQPASDNCLVRYDVLVKTKQITFEQYYVTRNSVNHEHLVRLINQVLFAIENNIFYRNLGWQCPDCTFKTTCLG